MSTATLAARFVFDICASLTGSDPEPTLLASSCFFFFTLTLFSEQGSSHTWCCRFPRRHCHGWCSDIPDHTMVRGGSGITFREPPIQWRKEGVLSQVACNWRCLGSGCKFFSRSTNIYVATIMGTNTRAARRQLKFIGDSLSWWVEVPVCKTTPTPNGSQHHFPHQGRSITRRVKNPLKKPV